MLREVSHVCGVFFHPWCISCHMNDVLRTAPMCKDTPLSKNTLSDWCKFAPTFEVDQV